MKYLISGTNDDRILEDLKTKLNALGHSWIIMYCESKISSSGYLDKETQKSRIKELLLDDVDGILEYVRKVGDIPQNYSSFEMNVAERIGKTVYTSLELNDDFHKYLEEKYVKEKENQNMDSSGINPAEQSLMWERNVYQNPTYPWFVPRFDDSICYYIADPNWPECEGCVRKSVCFYRKIKQYSCDGKYYLGKSQQYQNKVPDCDGDVVPCVEDTKSSVLRHDDGCTDGTSGSWESGSGGDETCCRCDSESSGQSVVSELCVGGPISEGPIWTNDGRCLRESRCNCDGDRVSGRGNGVG